MNIVYWDREAKREETERVYGDALVRFLYERPIGQAIADTVLTRAAVSRAYGVYQSSFLSRHKISPFIREFGIRMDEYERAAYRSFNDFFIRRFNPGVRPFESQRTRMPAFAEARYLAFEEIVPEQVFPVKGRWLSADALLGDEEKGRKYSQTFEGGPLLLARLCPVDYHRFHYPDRGTVLDSYRVGGKLHSVNPLALRARGEVLATNEREVTILETESFGKLAYIEVGAMMVGLIEQTHPAQASKGRFERGDEKGYFLFGASTVVVLGEPGAWKPDADLLGQTAKERETFVKIGRGLATASTGARA